MRKSTESGRPIRVCYPFVGNNVGGSHISTLLLVKHLDRSKVEPLVVLHEDGLLADYIRRQGLNFELIPIPAFFAPPYFSRHNLAVLFLKTLRLVAFLRRSEVDIVHCNDTRIQLGWSLASKLARAKLIWHQRTGSFGGSMGKLALAMLSQQVVCISRYTASTLPRRLAPLIRIVVNPFETKYADLDRRAARAAIIRRLDLASDTQLIGFFGNLALQKRPEVFLRAAAKMKEHQRAPLEFLLFGAERDNAKAGLTQLANELGIGRQVHFMGFQSPVEPWIAGCDLMIAPGVGDGLGRTLVESMIVGTPVVAADSGGHRDVIADDADGLLVTADDPEAFAVAACKLLDDPALAAKIAEHAKTRAIREFSIQRHVSEMTEIYVASLGGVGQVCGEGTPREETPC